MGNPTEADLLENIGEYRYGFSDPDVSVFKTRKGLDREVVHDMELRKGRFDDLVVELFPCIGRIIENGFDVVHIVGVIIDVIRGLAFHRADVEIASQHDVVQFAFPDGRVRMEIRYPKEGLSANGTGSQILSALKKTFLSVMMN